MNKEPYKAKIKAYSKINETTGCWEWQAGTTHGGYGLTNIGNKRYKAHRLAYELWVGPIPEGMFLCHKCDNPPCCNPEHMFVGTAKDNVQDAIKKGRKFGFTESARRVARFRKLTEEMVKIIRESPHTVTNQSLADKFGVSNSAIWMCRHGRNKIHSSVPLPNLPVRRYTRLMPFKTKPIFPESPQHKIRSENLLARKLPSQF